MRLGNLDTPPPLIVPWTARLQLGQQMPPLENELTERAVECYLSTNYTKLAAIEFVTARIRLEQHRCKIGIDGRPRSGMYLEAV